MRPFACLAFLAFASAALPAHADIYKCTDPAGHVVFQDEPCDGSKPRARARPPAASSPQGGSVVDYLGRIPATDRDMATLMYWYARCTRFFPDLYARSSLGFRAWRDQHAAAVSRIESNPDFLAALKRGQEDAAREFQDVAARNEAFVQCRDRVTSRF
jgi:hypothetical protein